MPHGEEGNVFVQTPTRAAESTRKCEPYSTLLSTSSSRLEAAADGTFDLVKRPVTQICPGTVISIIFDSKSTWRLQLRFFELCHFTIPNGPTTYASRFSLPFVGVVLAGYNAQLDRMIEPRAASGANLRCVVPSPSQRPRAQSSDSQIADAQLGWLTTSTNI
jgi:hypothetical protein